MILPLLAFETDLSATACVSFKDGSVSGYVFVALFASVLAVALIGIIKCIFTLKKAKESELKISRLETEKNSIEEELRKIRTSIMLSHIRPHFIYNTLWNYRQYFKK